MRSLKANVLDRFVRRAIKAPAAPNEAELQTLLGAIPTDELQQFWFYFTASRAFSVANTTIPDWKTRDQQACLQRESLSYAFHPKEKGPDGKYIIVREDFLRHVRVYLLKHIQNERQTRKAFREAPALHRIHAYIGIAVCVMALPFTLASQGHSSLAQFVQWLFVCLFSLYLVLGIVLSLASRSR